jgi:hypothetical protein
MQNNNHPYENKKRKRSTNFVHNNDSERNNNNNANNDNSDRNNNDVNNNSGNAKQGNNSDNNTTDVQKQRDNNIFDELLQRYRQLKVFTPPKASTLVTNEEGDIEIEKSTTSDIISTSRFLIYPQKAVDTTILFFLDIDRLLSPYDKCNDNIFDFCRRFIFTTLFHHHHHHHHHQ